VKKGSKLYGTSKKGKDYIKHSNCWQASSDVKHFRTGDFRLEIIISLVLKT